MSVLGRCGGCRFFKINVDPKIPNVDGHCHAGPPQMIVHPGPGGAAVIRSTWPMVGREQWCGVWQTCEEDTVQ